MNATLKIHLQFCIETLLGTSIAGRNKGIENMTLRIVEHPAVALEGIWSIKRNFPVGGLKPGLPSRNTLLPQAKYYSRHGGLRR
ncbi:PREDICTED: uncharacterized protein LOC107181384 [Myotis davidii]|uniref:uncharacterized protein LOC107181384 n=1 Tax=Myotis davidii TaxID=225400 RepID=UPI00076757BE|nr:PREDICTED: uncharacterized protein LOC107181384 [Myotis davidii]